MSLFVLTGPVTTNLLVDIPSLHVGDEREKLILIKCAVILYLTGLNYYGLLKPFFHLISICMYSQCDSTSLPVQRSQIKLF